MSSLLILTNAYDATTDLLIQQLNCDSIFRLNFDQLGLYRLRWASHGLSITDPVGKQADTARITKAYWRKPFSGDTESSDSSSYVNAESRYILRELVNLLWMHEKFTLVEPFAEHRSGKLIQLHLAADYFRVPSHEIVLHESSHLADEVVVKSLAGEPINGKVLYTTRVKSNRLDTSFPWFVQAYVPAVSDVTVVFVQGKMFGFSLRRDFLSTTADWRSTPPNEQVWEVHELPLDLCASIRRYMGVLRLDYGRLDFLLDENECYWFCEVNPNGQFAWLDLNRQHGVIDAVIEAISPLTLHIPLSNRHATARLACTVEGDT
jgi:hypothetical protein